MHPSTVVRFAIEFAPYLPHYATAGVNLGLHI